MRRLLALFPALALVLCLALPAQAAGYTDVHAGEWFAADITEMSARGWLTGYPDGRFQPMKKITAAEFVTVVARGAGLSPAAGVQSGHWAAGLLQAALQRGWYDWDECPPTGERYDRPISRQLAVKVLMKAFLPDARGDYNTESAKITDFSELDGRYYETTLAAYAAGVARGYRGGAFKPKGQLSRAEACALIARAARLRGDAGVAAPTAAPASSPAPAAISGGVRENGKLRVIGTQLCNEKGQPIVLHGMSSHGMQWYGQYASAGAIKTTADYGANLFRVAMYTGEGGYLSQPGAVKRQVIAAVDAAIANDLYVILDWHILSDGDPMSHLSEAKAFFAEMAARYKDSPAVLYEICNEPNGAVTWAQNVKPYATELVRTIRGAGSDGVILIGSPTWSQDIHLAAADPVAGEGLMYTLHFYAGTHGQWLRDRIDRALEQGLPLFVSEWGASAADGNGGVYLAESKTWLDFLDSRGISWANWSLCDKNESSAALKPGASANGGWRESDLSESGSFVFHRF